MVKILNILILELKCDFKDCYSLTRKKLVAELHTKMFKIIYSKKKRSDACKGKREERTQEERPTLLVLCPPTQLATPFKRL